MISGMRKELDRSCSTWQPRETLESTMQRHSRSDRPGANTMIPEVVSIMITGCPLNNPSFPRLHVSPYFNVDARHSRRVADDMFEEQRTQRLHSDGKAPATRRRST
ncbi:hypothetical protein HBI56_186310 [Parastagonospora nodorum]|uniref:Uncharacterized protein n=1 Tax=Phaeosphaeria nodorum (strain SN15 / ATCC MYA-4574 / FGSC 10173) TaxID=321614 RepID=A0A7U2IAY9_PHANO|nr:hypothetical protein HBH56_163280 [Parastagonospora nodorum]QRD06484.1 hypothetical protein JI435_423360 [Parastagonospora nodorum SN15]KAH3932132.1 hypothetical protein HBH54_085960 [Parastagonospora nodorum]KAH3947593.1 hypothetical protein HBH53_113240 [Parastagonospora nodorum]KAH3969165.1 hypothetical protein HBH52_176640 [Parastagonospora nodorum]